MKLLAVNDGGSDGDLLRELSMGGSNKGTEGSTRAGFAKINAIKLGPTLMIFFLFHLKQLPLARTALECLLSRVGDSLWHLYLYPHSGAIESFADACILYLTSLHEAQPVDHSALVTPSAVTLLGAKNLHNNFTRLFSHIFHRFHLRLI